MDVIILFGPPGSGKGTQAEILSKKFSWLHISIGQLLRKEIASQSPLGKKLAENLDKGNLASDKDTVFILEKYLENHKDKNLILDGLPRRVSQVDIVLGWKKKYSWKNLTVINLGAHEEELLKRLLLRAKKQKRKDDSPGVIKTRFRVYDTETKPVLNEFRKKGLKVIDIDGIGTIKEVEHRILDLFNGQ